MHSTTGMDFSTLTFILAGGQGKRLAPFTSGRAKPMVSFGGIFRIIDFTLSNCVNSGLERAYLLTQFKADSVRSYIEASSWRTDFVCLPSAPSLGYHGTADAIYKNMHLFNETKADYVLILAADHIYKMDYRKLLRFHASHGGDATIAAVQYPRRRSKELGILDVNERGQVIHFEEKPEYPHGQRSDSSVVLASMGIYVFNVAALRKALLRDAGNFNGSHEFGKDLLPDLIRTTRVFAYDFTNNNGPLGAYWRDVGNIDTYYRAQMELLVLNSTFDPYGDARWPVYAGGRYLQFQSSGPNAGRNEDLNSSYGVDSVISPDSDVCGATIQQSVLSPSVYVAPAAEISGSILMSGVRVGPHAKVRHAIIGEGVVVPEGAQIGCDFVEDRRRFHVTENGVVVIHGPDAARIGIPATSTPVENRTFVKATGAFESSTRKERRGAVLRSLRE
jgi:glucose-1-phosphate adenylyltransferase